MRPLLMLLLLLPVLGCSSAEEKAQREEQKAAGECTKAGYLMDSPAYEECKLTVKERDEQSAADRIAAGNNAGQFQSDRSGGPISTPSGYSMPMR